VKIFVDPRETATVVALDGIVDGLTSEGVHLSLSELVKKGTVRLVAEFKEVSYTSSAGLRVLLSIVKDVRQRGGDLRLAAVRPDVLRALQIAGFTSILKLYPGVDEALASFVA
jgi:anti-anti-sigma factor